MVSFFFKAAVLDDLPKSDLSAAQTHWLGGDMQLIEAIGPGEEPNGITVQRPELAHDHQGFVGQGNKTIFAAFSSANMDTLILGVNISNLKVKCLGQSQAE